MYRVMWKGTEYASFRFKHHAEEYIDVILTKYFWVDPKELSIVHN